MTPPLFMTIPTASIQKDLIEKSVLHLHAAAQTILSISQPLSSHLISRLLATAEENDVNLPESYIDNRVCQRCGTIFLPGVTCTTRTVQSRRQKRMKKDSTWVIYECKVCKKQFKTETEIPTIKLVDVGKPVSTQRLEEEPQCTSSNTPNRVGKRKRRERLQGLKSAIEKSKAEKIVQLDLLDLMKVD